MLQALQMASLRGQRKACEGQEQACEYVESVKSQLTRHYIFIYIQIIFIQIMYVMTNPVGTGGCLLI